MKDGGSATAMDDASKIFFQHHPDPMWVFDAETLVFLDVNEAAIEHYGYSREEFLQMQLGALALPEDAARIRAIVDSRPAGPGQHFITHTRRRSGEVFNAHITDRDVVYGGRPARLCIARDVTRLVALEEERWNAAARAGRGTRNR